MSRIPYSVDGLDRSLFADASSNLSASLVSACIGMVVACTPPERLEQESQAGSIGDDDDGDEATAPDSERLDLGEGTGSDDDGNDHGDGPVGCNHVDFLFVIDDSNSMLDEQQNLADSAPGFVDRIYDILELESIQLGVTASEAYAAAGSGCNVLGGLTSISSQGECGPFAGGDQFMTLADDLDETFPCAIELGNTGNSDERPAEAMVRALGPALNGDGQCNEGFVRDDALLVIVLVTDEEDDHEFGGDTWGSAGEPKDWFDAVVEAKGRPDNAVVLSLIGTPKPNECPEFQWDGDNGAEIGTRLRSFTEMFEGHGAVGDVCASDYGGFFDEVVALVETACDEFEPIE